MTESFDILVQLLRSVRQTILLSHNLVAWKFLVKFADVVVTNYIHD